MKVGQKVKFDPFLKAQGFGVEMNRDEITGTIVFVNDKHKWFSVEFESGGTKQRTSFKFCDIGSEVVICG